MYKKEGKNMKPIIYCDMDGVLADFDKVPNAVARYKDELNFFYNLEPISENVNAIRQLIEKNYVVKILSKSPHENADNDKRKWLSKYLPEIKDENIILARPHETKISFVNEFEKHFSVLLDDYEQNINEWRSERGIAFKITKEKTIPKWFVIE
jgi:5'(3')-deoxyribonucleotidase